MRALIILLALSVVALAIPLLVRRPPPIVPGQVFEAALLIPDAEQGETAVYRDESGNTLTYVVEGTVPGASDREPILRIAVQYRNRQGDAVPGGVAGYDHLPTRHGLFPMMAPNDPHGYDRVWVWTRIRRETVPWRGRPHEAWRFDLIDPALDPEADRDHVVAWLDETIPVYGLIRWQRAGRTWDLVDWSPRSR